VSTVTVVRDALESATLSSSDFLEALDRALPQLRDENLRSVSLVALLDDGSLEVISECRNPDYPTQPVQSTLMWSQPSWRKLADAIAGAFTPAPVSTSECILVPIMCGPILYGALEYRGLSTSISLPHDAVVRASEEFLPVLETILN
jgi:hypothetical protein